MGGARAPPNIRGKTNAARSGGGTSLAGGRYSLTGTLIGALIIQTLTTTVYTIGVAPEVTLVFKAVVVIAVCLVQAPKARAALSFRKVAVS